MALELLQLMGCFLPPCVAVKGALCTKPLSIPPEDLAAIKLTVLAMPSQLTTIIGRILFEARQGFARWR